MYNFILLILFIFPSYSQVSKEILTSLTAYDTKINQILTVEVIIQNRDANPIHKNTLLSFSYEPRFSHNYFREVDVLLNQEIGSFQTLRKQINLEIEKGEIELLPSFIVVSVKFLGDGDKGLNPIEYTTTRFDMASQWFKKTWTEAPSPDYIESNVLKVALEGLVSLTNPSQWFKNTLNEAPSVDKIERKCIIFGPGGAGKSFFINHINTALSDHIEFGPAVTFGGADHCSEYYLRYSIGGVSFTDTVGFTNSPRLCTDDFLKYAVLDLVPSTENIVRKKDDKEWRDFMGSLDRSYEQFLQKDFRSKLAQRNHVVLYFVPYAMVFDEKSLPIIVEIFQVLSRNNYNPLVVMSFVSAAIKPEEINEALKKLSEILGVPPNRIDIFKVYTTETKKLFEIDKTNILLLTKIHQVANSYIQQHLRDSNINKEL